jgi:hypothetical protein
LETKGRRPDSSRRRKDNGDVQHLGLAAGPLRGRQARGDVQDWHAGARIGIWTWRQRAGHAHRRAESSGRTLPWRLTEDRGKKNKYWIGIDLQTCTGTAKGNEIDEANTMVCSPSAKDQQWRRKGSPELERSHRSRGRQRSRRRIRVIDPITA